MRNALRTFMVHTVTAVVLPKCSLDSAALNVYMSWPLGPDSLLSMQLAAIESVFYNYPYANVLLLGNDLARSLVNDSMESLEAKGYCLTFLDPSTVEVPLIPNQRTGSFVHQQAVVYHLQLQYGGLYVPLDGALLNTVEYVLAPLGISLDDVAIFQEIEKSNSSDSFNSSDFHRFLWQRPYNDFHESQICSLHCLRYIPKNSALVNPFIRSLASGGEHPDAVLTKLVKPVLSSVVVLPSWLITEPKFPDHWTQFGSSSGYSDSSTDLFSPRQHRYRFDYWLVVSNKLWLPWSMGKAHEMNILSLSVVALVQQQMSLNLFPQQVCPLFASSPPVVVIAIKSPLDQIERLSTNEQILMRKFFHPREAGLPGDTGGYRTFRHLKIVGDPGVTHVRVTLTSNHNITFYCRAGVYHDACSAAVGPGSAVKICAPMAVANAVVSLLSYGGGDAHTGLVTITAQAEAIVTCEPLIPSSPIDDATSTRVNFTGLVIDPIAAVTVIAHSGGRCDLLPRMMNSIQSGYPGMKGIVTCECAPDDTRCPIIPTLSNSPIPSTDWFSVPFDFGLSRGKQFLISKVATDFVLVLDDDFTLSFNTCIECLLWRLKSQVHSAVLPFDIVGFPLLEDERSFGAFRGTIRVADTKFFIEPFTHSDTPDGCVRVDICPMVFLARTERIKTFQWNPTLPVGEHEEFFFANKRLGIQVGVCSDSSFTHFRPDPEGMTSEYKQRRGRQKALMNSALSSSGIGQTYYFFHKYSHQNEQDFEQLSLKNVHPYYVRDDSGEALDAIPGPLRFCYFGILSGTDSQSAAYRSRLRAHGSFYNRVDALGVGKLVFLVSAAGRVDSALMKERAQFNDIVWVPDVDRSQFILEFFRKFVFCYLFLVDAQVEPQLRPFGTMLDQVENREMKVFVAPGLLGLSRDIHSLLSHPMNLKYLRRSGEPTDTLDEIRAWMQSFDVTEEVVPEGAAAFATN